MIKGTGSRSLMSLACIVVAFICLCHASVLGATLEDAKRLNVRVAEFYQQGHYREAIASAEKVLAIRKEVLGEKHPLTATSYSNVGLLYQSIGEYAKAELLLQKALEINAEVLGEKHPNTAASYKNLGEFYRSFSSYAKSQPLFQKAQDIEQEFLGYKCPDTAQSCSNLGLVYQAMGEYGKAEPMLQKALAIVREALGEKHPDTATSYNNLGMLYKSMGDYRKAEPLYQKALAINKEVLGEKHPDTVTSYNNLGALYLSQGKVNRALRIFEETGAPSGLGHCYLAKGDYKGALAQFEKSLSYTRKSGDKEFLIADYIGLGLSYEGLRDYRKARDLYQQAVGLIEAQRESLMEPQRRAFFAGHAGIFFRLEPYEGLVRVSSYLKDAGEGFYWAENTRARVLLEAIARRPIDSKTGLPTGLAREEESLNNRIAVKHKQIEIAREKMPGRVKELEQELKGLQKEKKPLIARLRREHPEYASIQYPMPFRVNDLRLGKGEVLIEYEITDKETFAWLIRGRKVIKTITISITRKELTDQVMKYRGFFEGITGYERLSRFDPRMGKGLYDLLFKGLAPYIKKGEHIILIPDETLATLPFETLVVAMPVVLKTASGKYGPYPEGVTYLADRYPISYAQSATTLIVARTLKKKSGVSSERMLVVADPVLDFRLLGTARLAERLRQSYGKEVDVLKRHNATEQEIRRRPLNQYLYLVFATHGILGNEVSYIKGPALVLSQVGMNKKNHKMDGFLTMTEVMELKLNADVVALMASNTGMGKNLTGEGVMSMGRAFQYAGARSVLMSLWRVAEDSTTLLTERFFAHLKEKKPPRDALRQAQQDVRQAGYKHPFYWGAFILMTE